MKPTAVASNSAFIDYGLAEIFGHELTVLNPKEVVPLPLLVTVKESSERTWGLAETRGMFLRAGRAAFYFWMRQYSDSLGWHEVDFRLLPAPARIKQALTDALKWFADGDFLKGELTSTNDTWQIVVTGLVGEGARLDCCTFIGMMQELACWAGAGKFYPAREMECQAEGAERCLFEISKLPAG
jgi:hypothetical protein